MTCKSSSIFKKEEQFFENIPCKRAYREINKINVFKTVAQFRYKMNILSIFLLKLHSRFDSYPTVNFKYRQLLENVLLIKLGRKESPVIILGFEKSGRSTKKACSILLRLKS